MANSARSLWPTKMKGSLAPFYLLSAAAHLVLLAGSAHIDPSPAPGPASPIRVRLSFPATPQKEPAAYPPSLPALPVPEEKPQRTPKIAPASPPPERTEPPRRPASTPKAGKPSAQEPAPPQVPHRRVPTPSAERGLHDLPSPVSPPSPPAQTVPDMPQVATRPQTPPPPHVEPTQPAASKRASVDSLQAAPPAAPSEEPASPEALRALLEAILARIQKAKRYPEQARAMGIEGTAVVAFHILPGGGVGDLRLRQSSGHPSLDEASLDAVRRAAPYPYLRHALVLPIRYTLRDTEN